MSLNVKVFPTENGNDNRKGFKNKIIEDYLKGININLIYGLPYNPHS